MRTLPSKKQSGVVLVISLVMLLLLTLIGLTGMQTTTLEEKMAGNSKDRNIAFQAAESTLLEAEGVILTKPAYNNNNGLLDSAAEPDFFLPATWSGTNSAQTTSNMKNSLDLLEEPRYVIKKLTVIPANGANPEKTIFRITARAVGRSLGSQVILQEIYECTSC